MPSSIHLLSPIPGGLGFENVQLTTLQGGRTLQPGEISADMAASMDEKGQQHGSSSLTQGQGPAGGAPPTASTVSTIGHALVLSPTSLLSKILNFKPTLLQKIEKPMQPLYRPSGSSRPVGGGSNVLHVARHEPSDRYDLSERIGRGSHGEAVQEGGQEGGTPPDPPLSPLPALR